VKQSGDFIEHRIKSNLMYRGAVIRMASKKGLSGAKPGGSIADYIGAADAENDEIAPPPKVATRSSKKAGKTAGKTIRKNDLASQIAQKHKLDVLKSKLLVDTVFKTIFEVSH
jgi:hypothetical protein